MNVYQVVLLLILAFIGGITFLKLRYDINLVYAMLGIGLAGFSTDLWYYIITTRPYKFICRKLSQQRWLQKRPSQQRSAWTRQKMKQTTKQ